MFAAASKEEPGPCRRPAEGSLPPASTGAPCTVRPCPGAACVLPRGGGMWQQTVCCRIGWRFVGTSCAHRMLAPLFHSPFFSSLPADSEQLCLKLVLYASAELSALIVDCMIRPCGFCVLGTSSMLSCWAVTTHTLPRHNASSCSGTGADGEVQGNTENEDCLYALHRCT